MDKLKRVLSGNDSQNEDENRGIMDDVRRKFLIFYIWFNSLAVSLCLCLCAVFVIFSVHFWVKHPNRAIYLHCRRRLYYVKNVKCQQKNRKSIKQNTKQIKSKWNSCLRCNFCIFIQFWLNINSVFLFHFLFLFLSLSLI